MTQQEEKINIKTPKVYKNKKLNQANFGDFGLSDYQIFLYLVSKIGGVDQNGKYLQPSELKREHNLSAVEFKKFFNVDDSNTYKHLKKSVKKLMKTSIKIKEENSLLEINVCSQARYQESNGAIEVRFTEEIMPYLSQVREKFVLYNLREIGRFRSIYTTRLYEALQEFKDTGMMIKSVEQLRSLFAVQDKHKQYRDFKRKTFAKACEEINHNFELDLTFEEIKEGRQVVAIKFSFKKTEKLEAINPKTGEAKNIYKKPKQKPREASQSQKESSQVEQLSLEDMVADFAKNKKIQNS